MTMLKRPNFIAMLRRKRRSGIERDLWRMGFVAACVWLLLHGFAVWLGLSDPPGSPVRWSSIWMLLSIDAVFLGGWGLWRLSGWLFPK
jgi:type VI protein secretion system component VasK